MNVRKLAISIKEELYEEIQAAVIEDDAPSLSAWMSVAAQDRLRQRNLRKFLDEWTQEIGPSTPAELEEAQRMLDNAPYAYDPDRDDAK